MKKILHFLLNMSLLTFAACTTIPETQVTLGDYFQPNYVLPPKGMAKLYIYNPYTDNNPNNRVPTYINGVKVVDLVAGSYTLLIVKPGNYKVSRSFGPMPFSSKEQIKPLIDIQIQKDNTYYLGYYYRMTTNVSIMPGYNGAVTAIPEQSKSGETFKLYTHNDIAPGISVCRYTKPLATIEQIARR